MVKILKYLKEYKFILVMIVGLLVVQAYTDLALPGYTSKIVDVGIQQGGVDSAAAEVFSDNTYESLLLFLSEEDGKLLNESYTKLSKDNLSEKDIISYEKKYPIFKTESVYLLNDLSEDKYELLESKLQKALLLYATFANETEQANALKSELVESISMDLSNTSLMEIFKMMTIEDRMTIVEESLSAMSAMPESIQYQSAVAMVKEEYKVIGIDLEKVQNNYIIMSGIKMLLLAFLGMAVTIVVGFFSAKVASGFAKKLRLRVFDKVLNFSNSEFDKFSTASLITRSTNDIQQVEMSIAMILRMVVYAPILAIGGIIKVINTNTSMSWIIALGVGLIVCVMGTLLLLSMPKFKLMQTLVDRINLVSREILTGLSVIRAFGREKHEEERFEEANTNLMKTSLFINKTMNFMMPAMTIVMNGITVLILWRGAYSINDGTMQVGDLMAFIQYTMQIIMSFLMLSMLTFILPRAEVSATRIVEILDTPLTIVDKESTKDMDSNKMGYVEFDNVSFRYPNAEDDALSNLSFTAKPGETLAIIGSTGSGKSTLVNLIPRFYDVTKGSIKVNGEDIRELSQHELRDSIGYIPQKAVLFSGTIDSNMRYGKDNLTIEDMKKAARIAQAENFIEEKEDNYHSHISQGGGNVSGGQKQRLSIARAIAKDPSIYIFDDSFSALDYKTDVALRKSIKEELTNSTVIIVAQRISTIMHADHILVLDDGQIVGQGKHKDLLKNCEAYNQIASSQLSKEELEHE